MDIYYQKYRRGISKENFLHIYSDSQDALENSAEIIQKAFEKTGIWSVNMNAISKNLFAPSLNTTTGNNQPLQAPRFPQLLLNVTNCLHGNMSPSPTHSNVAASPSNMQLILGVPPALTAKSSKTALVQQNRLLTNMLEATIKEVQGNYAQMRLMDEHNETLQCILNAKDAAAKKKQKLTSGHPHHMTSEQQLAALHEYNDKIKRDADEKVRKAAERTRKATKKVAKQAAGRGGRGGRGTRGTTHVRGRRRGAARGTQARNVVETDSGVYQLPNRC